MPETSAPAYLIDMMKQASYTANIGLTATQPSPDSEQDSKQDSKQDSSATDSAFLKWLKHLFFYICAVTVTCMVGFYFLWQIPMLRDPASWLQNAAIPTTSRPLSTVMAPPTPIARPQIASQPPVNPIPTTPEPAAGSGDNSAALAASPPSAEAPANPDAAPATPESPEVASDAPIDPATEQAAAPSTDTPPAVPPSEIEQLLSDAQQQMDNRRFTAPASGNALRSYQRILELSPNHPAAIEGIQRITNYYQSAATESLRQGRPDESLGYVGRGLRASPSDQSLLNLRREAQLAKQQQEQATAQQARVEAQRQRQLQQQARQQQAEWQTTDDSEGPPTSRLRTQDTSSQPWWRQPSHYEGNSGFNQR